MLTVATHPDPETGIFGEIANAFGKLIDGITGKAAKDERAAKALAAAEQAKAQAEMYKAMQAQGGGGLQPPGPQAGTIMGLPTWAVLAGGGLAAWLLFFRKGGK